MAKRHSDGSGQKEQVNRRDHTWHGGAAVGVTALGGVGVTTAVAADLDKEELTLGDEIRPLYDLEVHNANRAAGSTATGVVDEGFDGYHYPGGFVSFQVNGNVDVTLDEVQ